MSDYNDGILPEPCLRMDTHFGDEYESIEFGDGTGYIKAAPILAKVGALHEEIDRLQDENAELRRELELDEPLFETLNAANDALLAENAELRELVRELLTDPDAWDYDYFKRRMRELGIGVDA